MATAEEALLGLSVSDSLADENKTVDPALKEQRKAAKQAKKAAKAAKAAQKLDRRPAGVKGANRDGMEIKKSDDFGEWFSQLVTKTEMIEFYDVSGCYILRPWSFAMWETIREYFDAEIKKLGVQNAYFPLFVSKKRLTTEEDHIEGFAAEVAWVTKSGKKDLEEPIAVRPTSETIMYPAYSKWIRSYRDLPLKLNQWSNVVRWEFKYPTPFIRSREFLWQEGHTAFATKEEADVEVLQILNLYRSVYEDLLAVPVIRGRKSDKEKFAGGLYTTTIEGFIPTNGRAIQAATSHCLGQNFSRMFKIEYEIGDNKKQFVWQNSWGLTTRSIGVMAMVHSDDKGLVLPPRIAPIQVVVVPILRKGMEKMVRDAAEELEQELQKDGIRVKADLRDDKNPGWKFNYWELKGVPLRLELGPRDIEGGSVMATKRVDGEKSMFERAKVCETVKTTLESIHKSTFEKARIARDEKIVRVDKWADFVPALDKRTMVLAPWCEQTPCEEDVKDRSGEESQQRLGEEGEVDKKALSGSAKTLCIPFEEELSRLGVEKIGEDAKCFACAEKATAYTLWGRSY
ncbi:Proline--tRNA ligase, cytoplasmic [Gracilariopsis chorda]|uniref:proline--tRNA ligase n=1 Tax=Gracilariopsis chorda TaxID=448386 RepID=A0A2V3IXL6_9FLOR|nr:Proline--tRNA ligase, cytoplasmic [Gracilariopsis chorda]|eukprot:PXF46904.1 Proline--tRNA ligase, cytoplasmic [Gracilariopsis chorda]